MAAKWGEHCASQCMKDFESSRLLKKAKHIKRLDTCVKNTWLQNGVKILQDNVLKFFNSHVYLRRQNIFFV